MTGQQFNVGLLKPCCADPANRRPGLGPRGDAGGWRDDSTASHCVICSCRHAEMIGEPGSLGLKGRSL